MSNVASLMGPFLTLRQASRGEMEHLSGAISTVPGTAPRSLRRIEIPGPILVSNGT